MTQKSEIEIEEEIGMIRATCDDCLLHEDCRISHTVEKILGYPETGYGVEEAVISFWNDCCPYINGEDE